MSEVIKHLPINFFVNMFFGALGAIIVVIWRLYNCLPEIEVLLQREQGERRLRELLDLNYKGRRLSIVFVKVLLSVVSAALLTALLFRPQDIIGAITSGMSWTGLIRGYIKK
jgi:hypothetical protein